MKGGRTKKSENRVEVIQVKLLLIKTRNLLLHVMDTWCYNSCHTLECQSINQSEDTQVSSRTIHSCPYPLELEPKEHRRGILYCQVLKSFETTVSIG